MCGYACVGCGRCGREAKFGTVVICLACGTENEKGAENCVSCGYRFAPGPGQRKSQDSA